MKFPDMVRGLFGRRVAAGQSVSGEPKRRTFVRSLSQMFKAAQQQKNDNWTGVPVSPDAFIQLHHTTLVARSREQWSNNDFVRAFIRIVRQNVVGPKGVQVQTKAAKPRGAMDAEANAAIDADWEDWGKAGNCEVTGTMTWRAVQCLAAETAARDGEFIIRKIYGKEAGPHGFALQLIDPQRLSVRYENAKVNEDGGFIRHSIEYNRYGKPVAYHFASTDEWDAYYYSYDARGFVRVPADEIIHGFVREQVGQRRGLPWASTSLFRLHHVQGFEDASVQNARAASMKMGFITYREGFGPEVDEDEDVAATVDAEPAAWHELPEGAEVTPYEPNYPAGEFQTFHKAMLRGASSGMGVPYNTLANDLEGVNFSSIRQGELDAREHYKEMQEWLIEVLCIPVRLSWLKYRLLAGAIKFPNGKPMPALKVAEYSKAAWQPRRWDWIDPKSDVTAKVMELRGGMTSLSQIIRERGRDPEQIFQELADDYKALSAAGLPQPFVDVIFGVLQAPEPAPSKGDESVAKEPAAK